MPANRGQEGYAPPERSAQDQERYAVVKALRTHTYGYEKKGSRTDDPGWHMCRCEDWEGYWCDFYDDHLAPEILKELKGVGDGKQL